MTAIAPLMPSVLVIGAMKCATSTICAYLEDHPDVYMAPGCEPNYFSHDENWAKGPDWYGRFFAPSSGQRLIGEGSNAYAATQAHPHVVDRIARTVPDVRLIYMVRDPVARIASAWLQNRADKGDAVPSTLDEAVRRMPERYVGDSLYWARLSDYRARFSDDQIFLGFMEDMMADQSRFMARLCAFLDLPPAPEIQRGHVNASAGKKAPSVLYSRLRRLPGFDALKGVAPSGLRGWVRRELLSVRHAAPPRFSPAALSALRETLAPDARALLAFAGKPADFWRYDV